MDIKDAGHFTTKSSVFQPTQLGAGGQQEIIRHMSRHYERVQRATAVTDTSPPKCLKESTLARDRIRKQPVDQQKYSSPLKVDLKVERNNDLISLTTNDSDVKSILKHVPGMRKKLKTVNKVCDSEADSLNTDTLRQLAKSDNYDISITTQECRDIARGSFQKLNSKSKEKCVATTLKSVKGHKSEGVSLIPSHGTPSCGTRSHNDFNATYRSDTFKARQESPRNVSRSSVHIVSTFDKYRGDEAKYLQFVADITQEIVSTGLTSDRALKMLFERHITQNRGDLRDEEMRRRIDELKLKLNIS